MSGSQGNTEKTSFFKINSDVVSEWILTPGARYTHDLFTCFLTIKDFYRIAFDEDTNLVDDWNLEFIKEVLVKDTNKIIKTLKEYRGAERRGVDEASVAMQGFLKHLYQVQILLSEKHKITNFFNAWTDSLILLQNALSEAYGALEHLDAEIQNFQN